MSVAEEAGRRYGRKLSWGETAGEAGFARSRALRRRPGPHQAGVTGEREWWA